MTIQKIAIEKPGSCSVCGACEWHPIRNTDGGDYVRCKCCGYHAQIGGGDRQVAFEEQQEKFYDDNSLCVSPLFRYLEKQLVIPRLKALRGVLPEGRLLEVGPGNGGMLRAARECGYHIEAVEHSASLADVIHKQLGIRVLVGAFEEQAIDPRSFDAFLSFHVIEHVEDPRVHFLKAADVVRPGGYAIIATPHTGSWEHYLPRGLSPNYSTAHLQLFSRKSMTLLLEQTGWAVMEVRTPCYAAAWVRAGTSIYRRICGKGVEIERGKFARGDSIGAKKNLLYILSKLTFPIRWLQETLRLGNELLIVAKRMD